MSCEFIKFNGRIRVGCVVINCVASTMLLPASIKELSTCLLEALTLCAAFSTELFRLYFDGKRHEVCLESLTISLMVRERPVCRPDKMNHWDGPCKWPVFVLKVHSRLANSIRMDAGW